MIITNLKYRVSGDYTMNEYEQLLIISNVIKAKQHLNNPYDENYIRRLKEYPQFLVMPYWENYYEYIYFLNLVKSNKIEGKILDFGCGTGHMDVLLARNGLNIHGIDLSPVAIDVATFLKFCEDYEIQKKLSFSLEDVSTDPSYSEKFDFIWCTHVMEHISDPSKVFEGLKKRISSNGKMLISVPLAYAYDDPGHVHHWMDEKEFYTFFSKFVKIDTIEINHTKKVIRGYFSF